MCNRSTRLRRVRGWHGPAAHSLVLVGWVMTLVELVDGHVEDFSVTEVAAKGLDDALAVAVRMIR